MSEIVPWGEIAETYCDGAIILGNGASIAVSQSFDYGSLLRHVREADMLAPDVEELFHVFGTEDFELLLRILRQANYVNEHLKLEDTRTLQAYQGIRDCLIRAVRDVHPSYADIRHYLPRMYSFLKQFRTVFSLNYDLLVYWVVTYGLNIEDGHRFKDCFVDGTFDERWRRLRNPAPRRPEEAITLIFYPHGNLALYRDIDGWEGKVRRQSDYLLDEISNQWCNNQNVPLFVSEGESKQKISSIRQSHYLSTVYDDVLTSIGPTLTLFGWGLGEQDRHMLRRMREGSIKRVAVSVFRNDQAYCERARSLIRADLEDPEDPEDPEIVFFDSESPGCWISG